MDKRSEANQLRKSKNYDKALVLYEQLWKESKDKFNGSGLLHCLRKVKQYENAIELADELIQCFPDFDWARNEVIWTYIEGKLSGPSDRNDTTQLISMADSLAKLNPSPLALQKIVFTVVKIASEAKKWELVDDWLDKLNPDMLDDQAFDINDTGKKSSWSYRARWYNHKLKALIYLNRYDEAIVLIDSIEGQFPFSQEKFFQRLKALALYKQGNLSSAEDLYAKLCSQSNHDWWLLYEYSLVIRDLGRTKDALVLMYKAGCLSSRFDGMVGLILDIASINEKLGNSDAAEVHYKFFVALRKKNDWQIGNRLLKEHEALAKYLNMDYDLKKLVKTCRGVWGCHSNKSFVESYNGNKMKSIVGILDLGKPSTPYCFIKTNTQSFFCYKSDLPNGVVDGTKLVFDAKPSFDKKKNQQSWKAINISVSDR